MQQKLQKISLFALVMLISGAIDSIRNLPATAMFGSSLIFFFVVSTIVFLIPVALISAELSSSWTNESGVFSWVNRAFGEKVGFFAIWLQWINTMVWYPTILSFIAGTLSFLIDPKLANNPVYLVSVILITFWVMTLVNLKGIKTSAKFASLCAIIGLVLPMLFIIALAIIWILKGNPLQLHLTMNNLIPRFTHSQSWISLTAIMTAFLGMELATVHVKNVKEPQRTFPKALFFSVLIIVATMVLGSLSIAFVTPKDTINLVDGVMQAFQTFLQAYHLKWMIPILTIMILIGSLGGMINWIISPAKGLLQAAQHGFLPEFLKRENKNGVAANLLLTQAVLVSFMCLAFLLMPSVNGSYWLLTDLSTQLYMIMYVFIFIAAFYLKFKFPKQPSDFKIPGGRYGTGIVCLLGLIGCAVTLIVGFFPPASINVGTKFHYEMTFTLGIILMILPTIIFYTYRYRNYN